MAIRFGPAKQNLDLGLSHKKLFCHFHTILNPTFFVSALFPIDKLVVQSGVLNPVIKIAFSNSETIQLILKIS